MIAAFWLRSRHTRRRGLRDRACRLVDAEAIGRRPALEDTLKREAVSEEAVAPLDVEVCPLSTRDARDLEIAEIDPNRPAHCAIETHDTHARGGIRDGVRILAFHRWGSVRRDAARLYVRAICTFL